MRRGKPVNEVGRGSVEVPKLDLRNNHVVVEIRIGGHLRISTLI
jgi:hypothetical protein